MRKLHKKNQAAKQLFHKIKSFVSCSFAPKRGWFLESLHMCLVTISIVEAGKEPLNISVDIHAT